VGGRARLRAASVVAGCLLLAGCQQVDRIGDLLGGPTDAELLQAVSLTPEDAAPEAVFEPYEGGDEVVGRTSLDLCYGDFPSEELRVGRNQVGIGDTAGQAWVSSEAILYGTPDEAEQAMGELERAREECPDTPVPPPQPERDPLTWAFEDPPDDDWPAEPVALKRMVSSGRPASPVRRVISWPRMVPTVRCTLRMAKLPSTRSPRSSAGAASRTSSLTSAVSRPCSWARLRKVPVRSVAGMGRSSRLRSSWRALSWRMSRRGTS
jgi:hypothetical protein